IATVEQDAPLALPLPTRKPLHDLHAAVDVVPPADVSCYDAKLCAYRREQIFQVDLLDRHLHVSVETIPERKRRLLLVCISEVIDPSLSEGFHGLVVDFLEMINAAAFMLRTEINGQVSLLTAVGDQPFSGIKVTLRQAVFLKDVGPTASRHLEIES